MAKWIRMLIRPPLAAAVWHVLASDRQFGTTDALCGERFHGAVEAATSDEQMEHDGRCSVCASRLAAKQSAGGSTLAPRTPRVAAAAKKAAATRRRRAGGKRAATTKKRQAAAKKAATTKRRRASAKKAAVTRKAKARKGRGR